MTDIWFYHLERTNLERVLPGLLEKTLERGWRALVVAGTEERATMVDTYLWSYKDDGFLPHGKTGEDRAADCPVLIGTEFSNQNQANVAFFVDGARPENWSDPEISACERCMFIFDGNLDEAVATARDDWKQAKSAGHSVTYWQQSRDGKWEKRA